MDLNIHCLPQLIKFLPELYIHAYVRSPKLSNLWQPRYESANYGIGVIKID
jgi:hypothetical protein